VIPNVVKGADPAGLLRYLAGPGRANEHVNPRVVAGCEFLIATHTGATLDRADANDIGAWLDAPRRLHGVQPRTRTTRADPASGEAVVTGSRDRQVWHASLSLAADEGRLSDENWAKVAGEFADAMGLTETAERAGCRWVAIHHGPSKAGNDHIHLVASMVREDGTVWNAYRDYPRAQAACRAIEMAHVLRAVDGPIRGVTERGIRPAEAERAQRSGAVLTEPHDLAQRLRVAAVASSSEAEFVRRARAAGVVIKPRYAPGGATEVVGYKAALPPGTGEGWVFHGGGKLARDLSLPRLREMWPAPSTEGTAAAVVEWHASRSGHSAADREGRETRHLHPDAVRIAADRIATFNERLAAIDPADVTLRAEAAREIAAALTALSRHCGEPELQRSAREVARHAAEHRISQQAAERPRPVLAAAVLVLLQTPMEHRTQAATRLITQQLIRAVVALHTQQRAHGREVELEKLRSRALVPLQRVAIAAGGAVPTHDGEPGGTYRHPRQAPVERVPGPGGVRDDHGR
jgi:hypothetical protein